MFNAIFAAIDANPNAGAQLELETVLNVDRAVLYFRYKYCGPKIENLPKNIKSSYDKWQARWKEYVSASKEAQEKKRQDA